MVKLELIQTLKPTCKGCHFEGISPCPGSDHCMKIEYYIFKKPGFFRKLWNTLTEITPLTEEDLSDPDFNQGKNLTKR